MDATHLFTMVNMKMACNLEPNDFINSDLDHSEGEDKDTYDNDILMNRIMSDARLKSYYDLFHKESFLCNLITRLEDVELLNDFIVLLKGLSDGSVPVENLPLIFATELVKFYKCTTTTLMRFHPKSKAFWHVGFHTWHRKGLLLLSGSKNRGEVRNKLTKRGYYNPQSASVNFIVPDVKTLFAMDDKFPKQIQPTSCIEESFDLINRNKEHVLMYDCKRVVRGFKGKQFGDEDLWGFEGPPTLKESRLHIEHELKLVNDIKEYCDSEKLDCIAFQCSRLMNAMSHRVKEIRKVENTHRKFLTTLERNPRSSELAQSFFKSQIYSCKSWTSAAMNCNRNLCEMNALLNDCEINFKVKGQ